MLKGHLPRVIYHQVYYYTKVHLESGIGRFGLSVRVGGEGHSSGRAFELHPDGNRYSERDRRVPLPSEEGTT